MRMEESIGQCKTLTDTDVSRTRLFPARRQVTFEEFRDAVTNDESIYKHSGGMLQHRSNGELHETSNNSIFFGQANDTQKCKHKE